MNLSFHQKQVMNLLKKGWRLRIIMDGYKIDSCYLSNDTDALIHKSTATIEALIKKGLIKPRKINKEIYYVKGDS